MVLLGWSQGMRDQGLIRLVSKDERSRLRLEMRGRGRGIRPKTRGRGRGRDLRQDLSLRREVKVEA